jgi:hypothetical protein
MIHRTLFAGAVASTLLGSTDAASAQAPVVDPPSTVYIVPAPPPLVSDYGLL